MNLAIFLEESRTVLEHKLEELLEEKQTSYHSLLDASRYAALGSGKRLRPILVLATAQVFGSDLDTALVPACAIELIHTYSLIHDDLPAMDDDDYRRGKPTVHNVFPESHAILAGDHLLTYAFELLSEAPGLTSDQKIQLIATLSKASGANGLIGGQVMDLESEGGTLSLDMLKEIHTRKTGALIQAAVLFGGIIGGATEEQLTALKEYSHDIGLAFQIIDDVLDITASEEKHGKHIGSDAINNKVTSATLLGIDKAKKYALQLLSSAQNHLVEMKQNTALLSELSECLVNRSR